jgi:hypothetical protein
VEGEAADIRVRLRDPSSDSSAQAVSATKAVSAASAAASSSAAAAAKAAGAGSALTPEAVERLRAQWCDAIVGAFRKEWGYGVWVSLSELGEMASLLYPKGAQGLNLKLGASLRSDPRFVADGDNVCLGAPSGATTFGTGFGDSVGGSSISWTPAGVSSASVSAVFPAVPPQPVYGAASAPAAVISSRRPGEVSSMESDELAACIKSHLHDSGWLMEAAEALKAVPYPKRALRATRPPLSASLQTLVSLLRDFATNEALLRAVCFALRNMCRGDTVAGTDQEDVGVASSVVKILTGIGLFDLLLLQLERLSMNDANSAEGLISVLWNMTARGFGLQPASSQVKCAQLVLLAIRWHRAHVGVAKQACGALRTLVAVSRSSSKEVIELVASSDAITVIIIALSLHREHLETVEQACFALSLICQLDGKTEQVKRNGGIDALEDALKAHRTNKQVARFACYALYLIFSDPAHGAAAASHAELLRPVMRDVQRLYPEDDSILTFTSSLLQILAIAVR